MTGWLADRLATDSRTYTDQLPGNCLTELMEPSWRDPFNQNSNRYDREKWSTSKGGPLFSKLFRLDRTDRLSFGPKFPEILVEWIAPSVCVAHYRINFLYIHFLDWTITLFQTKNSTCKRITSKIRKGICLFLLLF